MQPKARLSVILGMDIHQVQPKLIEEFSDTHGFMVLYACSLSSKLILCGNRVYPYTPTAAAADHDDKFAAEFRASTAASSSAPGACGKISSPLTTTTAPSWAAGGSDQQ